MPDPSETCDHLNRFVAIIRNGLPMYLASAVPWTRRGMERAEEVLQLVVDDQKRTIERIGELIVRLDGSVAATSFPAWYTSLNDVSLDYLVGLVIQQQQSSIEQLQAVAANLAVGTEARALCDEALGAERGHLESLQELRVTV